ncbi:OLC1v1007051C5 [Oldenlandia corymbosa var. corymbosa]|nr:OLC1v1007051C5 [Oldenlandia corymbosa var. corymbosa]
MESEGQRTPSTPSAVLASLLYKRANLHEELRNIEKQVYDMETSYLQDPSQCGNVLKGFDGFLTNKNTTLLKRSRKFQPEDRMFSLSSTTSPAAEEQAAGREVGGIYSNGQ